MIMKLYRLVNHQRKVYPEDLLLNPKEHPTVKKGKKVIQVVVQCFDFD